MQPRYVIGCRLLWPVKTAPRLSAKEQQRDTGKKKKKGPAQASPDASHADSNLVLSLPKLTNLTTTIYLPAYDSVP